LVHVKLVDVEQNDKRCNCAEIGDFQYKTCPIPILQGIVKAIEPSVQQNRSTDEAKRDRDYRDKQKATPPVIFRAEVGNGYPPNGG
jgi:hypothetical protein